MKNSKTLIIALLIALTGCAANNSAVEVKKETAISQPPPSAEEEEAARRSLEDLFRRVREKRAKHKGEFHEKERH